MSRRLTPRGEQRRAELLAFATERFATGGYHPTSVAELVEGLGVGKGVFYWYFESKEELFLEILREGQRALRHAQRDAIGDITQPVCRLEAAIRASMHWWGEHRDLYRLIQFATTETSFQPAIRQGEQVQVADTERHIRDAMEQGLIPEGDAEVVAQAVLGVSSTLARTRLLRDGHPPDDVADAVIAFCRYGLLGPAPEPIAAATIPRSA